MKILISAYACYPTNSSEPGVGWRTATEMAKHHDVWVLTDGDFASPAWIEKHLSEHPIPSLNVVFVKLGNRVSRLLGRTLHYFLWQRKASHVAANLHNEIHFDLCHHVTFGRYWTPAAVANLGIPFVWGPVGAAEVTPWRFILDLPWRTKIEEIVRTAIKRISEWNPRLRRTAINSTIAISITKDTSKRLKKLGAQRILIHPQVTMSSAQIIYRKGFPSPAWRPFRIIQIGRLVHWKGSHLSIRAFAQFARGKSDVSLSFVGGGPARLRLERLAKELDVAEKVTFHGLLPTEEDVAIKLAESHILIHPALHEAFGNVCLEAMAMGKPVICLDIGGPGSILTKECGFVVPAVCPHQTIPDMAGALNKLYNDEKLYAQLSRSALKRIESEYSTETSATWLNAIYKEVFQSR